jgi:hypothetical protein
MGWGWERGAAVKPAGRAFPKHRVGLRISEKTTLLMEKEHGRGEETKPGRRKDRDRIVKHISLRRIRLRNELPARRRACGAMAAGCAHARHLLGRGHEAIQSRPCRLLAEVAMAIGGAVLVLEA